LTYRPWFELDPEIFREEQEAMEARGFTLNSAALSAGKVEFQGRSQVDPSRPLTVRYPNEYPSLPPNVYSDTPGRYLFRHHHRQTGEICTFGPKRSQWHAGLRGTDAIDEAEEIISEDLVRSSDPDDSVPEPVTAELPFNPRNSLILPGEIVEGIGIPTAKQVGSVEIYLNSTTEKIGNEEYRRGVIVDVRLDGAEISAPERYKRWPFASTELVRGVLVALPEAPSLPRGSQPLYDWVAGFRPGGNVKGWTIFLYPDQAIERGRTQMQGFGVFAASKLDLRIVRVHQLIRSARSARVPGLDALGDKKVLLIGCGAIGSKVGVALAASGVRNLALVDGDHMEPGNSVRHEVGAGNFGLPKEYALLKRIHDLNPETIGVAEGIHHAIGDVNARVENDERIQRLAREADLIIDATGMHGISRYVNNLCQEFTVPGLFVSVTNGAWSGELIRTIPGETACWMCWNHQYGDIHPPAESPPPHGVFAPGCNQPTFTGTTYEVGMIANLASWIAVETLLAGEPDRRDVAGDYILWIGRDGAGAPAFKTEIFSVTKRKGCRWCSR
jgi:molybdopterin/thiamine biosynthesis adenylyltransferase